MRRIPDFNAPEGRCGSGHPVRRAPFHAFLTTADPAILDTIAVNKTHRARDHRAGPCRLEELRAGPPALPRAFTANAAWLVLAVIAFNLARAAGSLTEPQQAKVTPSTIRRKLIRSGDRSHPDSGHDRTPALTV